MTRQTFYPISEHLRIRVEENHKLLVGIFNTNITSSRKAEILFLREYTDFLLIGLEKFFDNSKGIVLRIIVDDQDFIVCTQACRCADKTVGNRLDGIEGNDNYGSAWIH